MGLWCYEKSTSSVSTSDKEKKTVGLSFQIQLKVAILKMSKCAASQVLYKQVISGFVPVNNPTTNGKVL